MRHLVSIVTILLVLSCTSKQPYEDNIVRAFEQNAKVVPIIETVTIDSTASIQSYKNNYLRRSTDIKDLMRDMVRRDCTRNAEDLIKWRQLNRSSKSTTSDRHIRQNEEGLKGAKLKLANLDSTYNTEPYIKALAALMSSSGDYRKVTVKYKLAKDGITKLDTFIISPDSTVYPASETLNEFLTKSLVNIVRDTFPEAHRYDLN